MGVDKVLTEYACDMQDLKPVGLGFRNYLFFKVLLKNQW